MARRTQQLIDRRKLLGSIGSGAAVAAAGVAVSTIPGEAEAYDPGTEETRARYQPDSPNVQAFYRTNGYETLKK